MSGEIRLTVVAGEQTPRRDKSLTLSVVVPCFNEEQVIAMTHRRLVEVLGTDQPFDLQVVYINDGSRDTTGEILARLARSDRRVKVITFSRNFGHQPAVSAGLRFSDGQAVAVIDADLQDPPEVILTMLDKWREGYDVVFGIRKKRKESAVKRFSYSIFYRLFRAAAEIDAPLDAGDFSLLDRRVVDVLNSLPETNRYVRGLRAWVGFRQVGVAYDRAARAAGETKYPFRKLLRLAFDGIFNFSTAPLSLVFGAGIATAGIAAVGLILVVMQRIFDVSVLGVAPDDVPGFAALALMILFIGGVQMVSTGILGEYIGRIYREVKQRPAFVVSSIDERVREPDDPSSSD